MVEFNGKFDEKAQTSGSKRSFKSGSIFILIFCAILLVVGIIGLIFREDAEDLGSAIYCIVLSVLFYPLFCGIYAIMRKSLKNNSKLVGDSTEQQFQFFEDGFICSQTKGDEFKDVMQAKYSVLIKIIETKEQYFIYITKTSCFVINKADLTAGTLEELNTILTNALGPNFKKSK